MRVCMPSCFNHVVSETVAPHAPLSMGLSRQEYWSGLPCPPPGDLPNSGIKLAPLMSPESADRLFTIWATWEVPVTLSRHLYFYFWSIQIPSTWLHWLVHGWSRYSGQDDHRLWVLQLDWISNCLGLHLSLLLCLQQGRDQKLLNTETEWVHSMERNRIKDSKTVRDKEEREQERDGKTDNILWVPERSAPPPHIVMLRALIKSFLLG